MFTIVTALISFKFHWSPKSLNVAAAIVIRADEIVSVVCSNTARRFGFGYLSFQSITKLDYYMHL